jgi:hypothetical protein
MSGSGGHGARGCSALRCINYYQQTGRCDAAVARDTNDGVRWLLRLYARHFISGLESAILNFRGQLSSNNVGIATVGSGEVQNLRVAVEIWTLSHSVPEKYCTSGLQSAILNSGSQSITYSNMQ